MAKATQGEWVGDRLYHARTAREMSQTALAKKSRVGQTTIHALEHRISITSRRLPELAKALGVRQTWLSQGQGPMDDTSREDADAVLLKVFTFNQVETHGGDIDALTSAPESSDRPLVSLFRRTTDHKSLFAVEMEARHPLAGGRLQAGDTIVLNRDRRPENGNRVLIRVHALGRILFREVRYPEPIKKPKKIEIVGASDDESSFEINLDKNNFVVGVEDTLVAPLGASGH